MANEYDMRAETISFREALDSAIMSPPNLGASPVHNFASSVDWAIKSDTASSFGASPEHVFASSEGNMRAVVAQSSHVVVLSNAAGHVAAPLLSMAQLVEATNNFSLDNKIGAGSFGDVYRGKLVDGRKVVIKRSETMSYRLSPRFNSELAFLSRLHNKHLVGLVGFLSENKGEKEFLVYEYMKNGTLYHHLHALEGSSNLLNSWKMRINIALDTSLGIEYLHNNYEGRSIVHRNINSKNILLDATWTARVSDFGLPLMFMKKEAETNGYMDAEYFWEGTLTTKSDVYALGFVFMELLTGKTEKSEVDIVVRAILNGDLMNVLDPRVEPPSVNEKKALMLVANTALSCVNSVRRDRPIMSNVVVNLKKALAICDDENHQQLPEFWGAWVEEKREMERKKYTKEENGGKYNE